MYRELFSIVREKLSSKTFDCKVIDLWVWSKKVKVDVY